MWFLILLTILHIKYLQLELYNRNFIFKNWKKAQENLITYRNVPCALRKQNRKIIY